MHLRFQFGSDLLEGGDGASIDNISIVGIPDVGRNRGFNIISVALSDLGILMTWNSEPGKSYAVEYSETLADWIEIGDGLPSAGEETSFTDTEAGCIGLAEGWYRVREKP